MSRPNVVLVLVDDMGFSDIGSFGSEIQTPNLDRLAASGVSMSQFYNTARCSPSRASLLTGLHPHQTGVALLVKNDEPDGYPGRLSERCVTAAEVLHAAGYGTSMSGKWHVTGQDREPDSSWPCRRGFDRFFGTLRGAGSYFSPPTLALDDELVDLATLPPDFYYTSAISEWATKFISDHLDEQPDAPFFSYVAYTAPHWPLHAPEDSLADQRGRYDVGWDEIRRRRLARQDELGVFAQPFAASDRDPEVSAWELTPDKTWEAHRMEAYAAQVAAIDDGVGRILGLLEDRGVADNTMVIFLSDNGGSEEELPVGWDGLPNFPAVTPSGLPIRYGNSPDIDPGDDTTFVSYGRPWANVSNAPFREYKHWVHEGGIATPLIATWPAGGLIGGARLHAPHQLTDILPTLIDATGATYPRRRDGEAIPAIEGVSMLGAWRGESEAGSDHFLYWEHEGNRACRRGSYKLVAKYQQEWELYNIDTDRAELVNIASAHPDLVAEFSGAWDAWADRVGVKPREQWEHLYSGVGG